jgi:hypothetical protein
VFDGNAQEQVYRDLKAIFEPTAVVPQVAAPVAEPAPVLATEAVATVIASSKSSNKKPKKVANSK